MFNQSAPVKPCAKLADLGLRLLIVVGATLMLLLQQPTPGYACSCATVAPREARDRADAVLAGRVTAIAEPVSLPQLINRFPFIHFAPGPNVPLIVTIAVDTVWKGPDAAQLQVLTANPATSQCEVYITVGARYIIYAQQDGTMLRREACQRIVERPQAGADIAQLGPGALPAAHEPLQSPSGISWLFAGLLVVSLVMLLLRRLLWLRK